MKLRLYACRPHMPHSVALALEFFLILFECRIISLSQIFDCFYMSNIKCFRNQAETWITKRQDFLECGAFGVNFRRIVSDRSFLRLKYYLQFKKSV